MNDDIDMNREVAEALGVPYHSWETTGMDSKKYVHGDPDFSDDAGAVALLRLMEKHEKWWDFAHSCKYIHAVRINAFPDKRSETVFSVESELITTPGKMLEAVHQYFKGKGAIKCHKK